MVTKITYKNNWFWQTGRTGCSYIYLFIPYLFPIGEYIYVLPNDLCLSFFHRLRILTRSDTIYKIVRGATSDGPWKEIWERNSGTRGWPRTCYILDCSNDASLGAHVGINKIQRKYILPVCVACSFKEDVIKVKKKSFAAPIFKRDIDMMLK